MPKRLKPDDHWTESKWMKAMTGVGIGVVAIPYFFGFLVWSLYSNTSGFGFLPLSASQYIPSGILAAFFVVAFTSLTFLVGKEMSKQTAKMRATWQGRAKRLFIEIMARVVVAFGITTVLMLISAPLALFKTERVQLEFLPYWFALGAVAVFLLALGSYNVVPTYNRMKEYVKRALKKLTLPETAVRKRKTLGKRDFEFLAIEAGGIGLAALLVFSLFLLPGMRPAYGGALPRHAYLDLSPGDFSTSTLVNAFGNWTPGQEEVVRTPAVTVFYYDSHVLLVKADGHDGPKDRLMEISRSLVRAITWID